MQTMCQMWQSSQVKLRVRFGRTFYGRWPTTLSFSPSLSLFLLTLTPSQSFTSSVSPSVPIVSSEDDHMSSVAASREHMAVTLTDSLSLGSGPASSCLVSTQQISDCECFCVFQTHTVVARQGQYTQETARRTMKAVACMQCVR